MPFYNKHTCREVSPGLDAPRVAGSLNLQPPNHPYCMLTSFRKLHLMASMQLIISYGVQNNNFPNKFWNKNQQTFEYSFKTTYLKRKKTCLVGNRFDGFFTQPYCVYMGNFQPCYKRDLPSSTARSVV